MNVGANWEKHKARIDKLKAKGINGNGAGLTLGAAAAAAGWPTPRAQDSKHGPATEWELTTSHAGTRDSLRVKAALSGWTTPMASDGERGHSLNEALKRARGEKRPSGATRGQQLGEDAMLAGWATPTARDWKSEKATLDYDLKRQAHSRGKPLGFQAIGTVSLSPAQTEKRGALNPALSRWLMGYPTEWDDCAPTGTQLSRKSEPKS